MENPSLELLQKAEFSPVLINTIQGDCIPTNPTLGELIFLATYLPSERYPELLAYIHLLPHYILLNMYWNYEEENEFATSLFAELQKKSITFNQKLAIAGFVDDGGFSSEGNPEFIKFFIELVDLCEDFDDCMRVMHDVADKPQEIQLVLEKMKSFSPTFKQWEELQENHPNQEARIQSLKEMIQIAEEKNKLKHWLIIYKHCLSGSSNEKLALEKIASFNLDSYAWHKIYNKCEEFDDYRIAHLAIKNLQDQKADWSIWFEIFIDSLDDLRENEAPNPLFLAMLLESQTALVEDYYCLYGHLSDYPNIQIIVMQKIISIADTQ